MSNAPASSDNLTASAWRYVAQPFSIVPHEGRLYIYSGGLRTFVTSLSPAELPSFFETEFLRQQSLHEAAERRREAISFDLDLDLDL